jgi:hypothetical protein
VLCVVAALDRAGTDRPVTALVHQIGWTMGAGPLLEAIGCRPGRPRGVRARPDGDRHELPIVPIVTADAGESLLVLSDGQRLAATLGLDRRLRVKALPVSVSLTDMEVGLVKGRARLRPATSARAI